MKKHYTAYIIPQVIKDGKLTNLVMKSKFGASIALSKPCATVGYSIEGTTSYTIRNLIRGLPTTKKQFYNLINKNVTPLQDISEEYIENFCKEYGFTPTKLIPTK